MNPKFSFTEIVDNFISDAGTNERMPNKCVKSKVKHGDGSIQVWGCSSYNGVGDL